MSLDGFREFETKYPTKSELLLDFKGLVESFDGLKSFQYVQGYDTCYTNKNKEVMRFRKVQFGKYAEVTWKSKRNKTNNVDRTEINWRVDGTDFADIAAGAEFLGWKLDFDLWKMCHIYRFDDANIVFYSVRFENGDLDHFIEIEVDEKKCIDTQYSWSVIYKYEEKLASLGVSRDARLKESLAEMARRKK